MNLPVMTDILTKDKDLLLYYYFLTLAGESSSFDVGGVIKRLIWYQRKDIGDAQIKKELREKTGLSAQTINKYMKTFWADGQNIFTFLTPDTLALVDSEKMAAVFEALEQDFDNYAERNRVFRVLLFMHLQCFSVVGYTRSQVNIAHDVGMQKQQTVAALDYILSKGWIALVRNEYYDPRKGAAARTYKLTPHLLPQIVLKQPWIQKHIEYNNYAF